jgi:hypothetical protein
VNILKVASCRLCGKAIHFSDDQVSELTGKKIPLDETGEPHNCTKRKNQHRGYYTCRNCGKEIYFDDDHKSKNDKFIPISRETGEPHECEGKNME